MPEQKPMRPNLQTLDEITRKLAEAVPQELKVARAELEEQFRAVLESVFARMDLVTREEFEIQQKVLARTREKLELIQRQLEIGRASCRERVEIVVGDVQAEDGIRDRNVTGVQTCALPISKAGRGRAAGTQSGQGRAGRTVSGRSGIRFCAHGSGHPRGI